MIDFIADIVGRFGGRTAGSNEERSAQMYLKKILDNLCDAVEVHEFQAKLTAKFHSLKLFCVVFFIAVVIFNFNIYIAAVLAFMNGIVFLGHFLFNMNWLDFLYKNHSSLNIIGNIEPQKEVKSTVLVAGHMDSVFEFQWWHKFGKKGTIMTGFAGAMLIFQGIFYVVSASVMIHLGYLPFLLKVVWGLQIVLSPVLITLYAMHGKVKVDGALDNLTGVALALEMGQYFQGENQLKHTRLKVVSFGAEETGLCGSKQYVKDHLDELQNHSIVLNTDTILSDKKLTILEKEFNSRITYDGTLSKRMEEAFIQNDTEYIKVKLPIGGTDGAPFAAKNIPTVSIIGMSSKEFEFTYHTREDQLVNLDPKGIEALKKVMITFIEDWDKDQFEK